MIVVRQLVGLIGTNGAGKSHVCRLLQETGFAVVSLSDQVRLEAKRRGYPLTRDSLTQLANEMKATRGQDCLAKDIFDEVKDQDRVVFDSIRNESEILFLNHNGVVFLGIDAPIELRFHRIQQRNRVDDQIDFTTFVQQDCRERDGSSSGQNITLALSYCETIIYNYGTEDELNQHVRQFLEQQFRQQVWRG